MFIFELKLKGKKKDNEVKMLNVKEGVLLSEWDLANIIRILKTRNKTLYKKMNSMYDKVVDEYSW